MEEILAANTIKSLEMEEVEADPVIELARENVFKLYHLFRDHRHQDQWTKEAISLSKVRPTLE